MSREEFIASCIRNTADIGGEYWECGTFQGDLAAQVQPHMIGRTMRLFDTFCGQPYSGPYDKHKVGSMNQTSMDTVSARFADASDVYIHPGIMPMTFAGLESSIISVANIDVDNHDSVRDCLTFIYSRAHKGAYIILDDYCCPDCPGARKATDEFLGDKPEKLLFINSQAYIIKE
jgi:O-methyltransferase